MHDDGSLTKLVLAALVADRQKAFALGMSVSASSSSALWESLRSQVSSLTEGEPDPVANCANTASLLYWELLKARGPQSVNWVGFYMVKSNVPVNQPAEAHHRVPLRSEQPHVLVLGPFHGQVACIRIPFGRGVCGTAAVEKKTQLVPDVHLFPGHIACDSASNSEIVVPVFDATGALRAVLDLDCPVKNGFDAADQEGRSQTV